MPEWLAVKHARRFFNCAMRGLLSVYVSRVVEDVENVERKLVVARTCEGLEAYR